MTNRGRSLRFREIGIKRETKIRIAVLTGIFLCSLVLFECLLNVHREEVGDIVSEPGNPIIRTFAYDQELSILRGYGNDMDAAFMRESIVPLPESREFVLHIEPYGNKLGTLSYELRSLDTSRKIDSGEFRKKKLKGGKVGATATLSNLLEQGVEYLVILTLDTKGKQLRFYTRVLIPVDAHVQECLDFAKRFHNTSLSENYTALADYLEPKEDVDTDTLSRVTINSSIAQVAYNDFGGKVVGDVVTELKDISDSFCTISKQFLMKRKNHYFTLHEDFMVRYTPDRMYLLSYERTMDELPGKAAFTATENLLEVGVAPDPFELWENETGTICAFNKAGSLFEYNLEKKQLMQVYSFASGKINESDVRVYYDGHGIKVLKIDENGNMDFVVYGYMNSGVHEGKCGMSICHFDSTISQVREEAFVSTTSPYQILGASFSELIYRSGSGQIYIMLGNALVQIESDGTRAAEVISNLTDGQYAVSASGRYIAWTDTAGLEKTIYIWDLQENRRISLEAQKGQYLKPLAFIGEDFVYGKIRKSDLVSGSGTTPMYALSIDAIRKHKTRSLKEYRKKGIFVTDVDEESGTLFLKRAKKSEGKFVPVKSDTIISSENNRQANVQVYNKSSSLLGEVKEISLRKLKLSEELGERALDLVMVPIIGDRTGKGIFIEISEKQTKYYVYVGGSIIYSGTSLRQAIRIADKQLGVVVSSMQQPIFRSGKALYRLPDGTIPEPFQKVRTSENLLNLTGCTLEQVLYYASINEPLYAQLHGEMVAITGYNSLSVNIYHFGSGRSNMVDRNKAAEQFSESGNVFYALHGVDQEAP